MSNLNNEIKVPYTIVRSRRKSYGISIDQDGNVTLRIPLRGSQKVALEIAKKKEDWILATVQKQKEKAKQRQLHVAALSEKYTPAQREALEKRYRQAAKEYFPKRASYYASLIGVSYDKIRIADQKTRWGSCSSNGTLSFNYRLMLAPPRVLDYVVVHEVCHLKHMNHSKAFWAQVEALMPGYQEYRKWLKENGSTLQL